MRQLRALPRLGCGRTAIHSAGCKLCGAESPLFDRVDFNKFCNFGDYYSLGISGVSVDYRRCTSCGFLFTDFCDTWSTEDFHDLIYNDDYIKVDGDYVAARPTQFANAFADRFRGAKDARILDYGCGTGVFVQRMREHGFRGIDGYDPFTSPSRPHGRYDIITCFEVIEHSTDPPGILADMLGFMQPDGCIVLSQTLQPDDIMAIRGSWWYLAPRNGHVSTYTKEAFEILGRRYGMLFDCGDTVHGFHGDGLSAYARIALASVDRPAPKHRADDNDQPAFPPISAPALLLAERLLGVRRKIAPAGSRRERMLRRIYVPLIRRLRRRR